MIGFISGCIMLAIVLRGICAFFGDLRRWKAKIQRKAQEQKAGQ